MNEFSKYNDTESIRIDLNLSRHCIQTEAKLIYEKWLRECLKLPEDELDRMEENIEALRIFLETTDFGALRSAHKALAGGWEGEATLIIYSQNRFVVEVDGEVVV